MEKMDRSRWWRRNRGAYLAVHVIGDAREIDELVDRAAEPKSLVPLQFRSSGPEAGAPKEVLDERIAECHSMDFFVWRTDCATAAALLNIKIALRRDYKVVVL